MRAPSILVSLLLLTLGGGCMLQNASRGERLRDSVDSINDVARWGRINLAVQQVHPEFRQEYLLAHRTWGRTIRVADSELMQVQMDEGGEGATSTVVISWYRLDTMTLHSSVVQQRWTLLDGDFLLEGEQVVEGDPRIFAEPPEEEAEWDEPEADSTVVAGLE